MGKLSFGDILKPFYQGDLQGKKRYLRITKKIKNKEPFQLVTGESVVLEYANSKAQRGFETGDLNTLAEAVAGSYKFPFKRADIEDLGPNAKAELYPISKLEKTAEFGGGSTGKVADPHELMTAALIIENGTSNTVVPKEKYNTLKKRSGRAITGLSMGGHGAFYLSFRHQDIWGAAGSISGGLDISRFYSEGGESRWNLIEALGDQNEFPEYLELYDSYPKDYFQIEIVIRVIQNHQLSPPLLLLIFHVHHQ